MNGKKRINLTFLLFCFKLETVNNAIGFEKVA